MIRIIFVFIIIFVSCSSRRLQEVGFLDGKSFDKRRQSAAQNLEEINSKEDDFAYISSRAGKTVLFTTGNKKQRLVDVSDGQIIDFEIFNKNTKNSGSAALSIDEELLIFTECENPDSSCILKAYQKTPAGWLENKDLLKNIPSEYWDGHPFLSYDGRILFFSSTREGGFGGKDLYYSHLRDSVFSKPVNCGNSINTPYDEESPFLSPDFQYLIFSSNGHKRLGGFDIFISKIDKELNNFKKPEALPFPYNSEYDDLFFYQPIENGRCFVSSNRPGGKGGLDIYQLDALPYSIKNYSIVYGRLIDEHYGNTLSGEIFLEDISDEKSIQKVSVSQSYQEFYCIVRDIPKKLLITGRSPGHLFQTAQIQLNSENITAFEKDLLLKSIHSAIDLKVFFDFNSSVLKSESYYDLNAAYRFLKDYQEYKVEVSGHTDNVGSERINQELSQKRAGAVRDYLVNKGISSERIIVTGYGSSKPRADNDTEENRSKNRRVEFKILQ